MTETAIADESVAPPAALGHRQILIAFSGLVLAMLLAALDSTIVSTALPTIVSELGGLEHLAWVVTGYLLAQTIVTPIYGKLGCDSTSGSHRNSAICTAVRSCCSPRSFSS